MIQKCPSFKVIDGENSPSGVTGRRIANFHNIWIYDSIQLMRKKKALYIFSVYINSYSEM